MRFCLHTLYHSANQVRCFTDLSAHLPVLMRAVTQISPPLQWKGGLSGHGSSQFVQVMMWCPLCSFERGIQFHHITRHLVLPVPDSMDNLFGRLCESGYPDAEATEIIEGLTAYSNWTQSGASKHLLALIGKIHIGSWFSLRQLTTIFVSCRSALAGSSLGDVLFPLGFARVMDRISGALES